jgi:primase-polymerase (primpol)-like protein
MTGIVMNLQICSKYTRGIYHALSWFYKYLECMLEGYVGYSHDFQKYFVREICWVLSWFYKYLVNMLKWYVGYCHDFTNI